MMAENVVTPAAAGSAGKDKRPITVHIHHPLSRVTAGAEQGSGPGHLVSLDARELARECLREVGHELGVPR